MSTAGESVSRKEPVRFAAYELRFEEGALFHRGRKVKLQPQPLRVLEHLVARAPAIVSREELGLQIWGPGVHVELDQSVNYCIRQVRQVLGDSATEPRFIETLPKLGYRFVGPIEPAVAQAAELEPTSETLLAEDLARAQQPIDGASYGGQVLGHEIGLRMPSIGDRRRLWHWLAMPGLAVALVAAGGTWRVFHARHSNSLPIKGIAVLPLENLSGDAGQEYLADGMTDELITMLVKNSSLRVVSRTSAMQYKWAHRPLPEIARALGVDGILEGSISRYGDKVHINMQLIQASSDTHVWAESYDRSTEELPSLSREAALTIAAQRHRLAPHSTAERYVSPEAHDAYLKGRYYWFAQDGKKAIEYYKRATELQPDYALAWSGLSGAYVMSAVEGTAPPSYFAPLGEQAARRALEVDDALSEAQNSMQGVQLLFRWDAKEALRASDRAIARDPQNGEAYFDRSLTLESLNRLNDALEAAKRAAELAPFERPFSMPQVLFRMRNYDAAIREARIRLGAQPNDLGLHWGLVEAYQCKGLEKEAAREDEKVALLGGGEAEAASVKHAYERGGYKAILEKQLTDVKEKAAHQYVPPLEFAWAYVNLRRKEEALYYAEAAYREHAPALVWIQNWPEWDFLHPDERYREIVRRMGLPPAW